MKITCVHQINQAGEVEAHNSGGVHLVSDILNDNFDWVGDLGGDDLGIPWPVETVDGEGIAFYAYCYRAGDYLVTEIDFEIDVEDYAKLLV